MNCRIGLLQIFFFVCISIQAQKNAVNIQIRDLNSKHIEVTFEGQIFTYDFVFPQVMSIDSYFVSTTNDVFYIKYEYTGSATSKNFYLVGFRWNDGKIYLIEYVQMNNQKGKWTGIARVLKEKCVTNHEDIDSIISSFETESAISVIKNSKRIGTLKIPEKIADELNLDDNFYFEILNDAKKFMD